LDKEFVQIMLKLAFFAFLVFAFLPLQQVDGHALFNSAESTIGDNRVQIATVPEIPEIDEKVQILFRVTDLELNEVPRFVMGIRIFYDDAQIDGIAPQSIEGGHWNFDYVFKKQGNHIFRVDLYDSDGKIITHTFNVSTQSPFGYIFIYVIASGAIGLAVLVAYIYLPKKFKKAKP
jgi:hypothetical protein